MSQFAFLKKRVGATDVCPLKVRLLGPEIDPHFRVVLNMAWWTDNSLTILLQRHIPV